MEFKQEEQLYNSDVAMPLFCWQAQKPTTGDGNPGSKQGLLITVDKMKTRITNRTTYDNSLNGVGLTGL